MNRQCFGQSTTIEAFFLCSFDIFMQIAVVKVHPTIKKVYCRVLFSNFRSVLRDAAQRRPSKITISFQPLRVWNVERCTQKIHLMQCNRFRRFVLHTAWLDTWTKMLKTLFMWLELLMARQFLCSCFIHSYYAKTFNYVILIKAAMECLIVLFLAEIYVTRSSSLYNVIVHILLHTEPAPRHFGIISHFNTLSSTMEPNRRNFP